MRYWEVVEYSSCLLRNLKVVEISELLHEISKDGGDIRIAL
jgi:hypothetical protein